MQELKKGFALLFNLYPRPSFLSKPLPQYPAPYNVAPGNNKPREKISPPKYGGPPFPPWKKKRKKQSPFSPLPPRCPLIPNQCPFRKNPGGSRGDRKKKKKELPMKKIETHRPAGLIMKNGSMTSSGNGDLKTVAIGSDFDPICVYRQGDILESGQTTKWIIRQDNQFLLIVETHHQKVYDDGTAENEYKTDVFKLQQIPTNNDSLPTGRFEEDVTDIPQDPLYTCPHCGESFRFSTFAEHNKKIHCALCGNPFRVPAFGEPEYFPF
jgi:hypothetical protein